MNQQSSLVLLNRLLAVKESTPFVLLLDSLVQSSYNLVKEFAYKGNGNGILYVSFETINRPSFATEFIECDTSALKSVTEKIQALLASLDGKVVIIIDSLNYIPRDELTSFIASIALPTATIVATYHTDTPQPQDTLVNFPDSITVLTYIANTIFEIEVDNSKLEQEDLDNFINRLHFPCYNNLNSSKFKVKLTNKRKSGRSINYNFIIDTKSHLYEVNEQKAEDIDPEDELLLKDLTTFNLNTNSKQKLAKDQVLLPFMEAQEAMGAAGGAIVYEFEKDDDYDEEDPYEDPF